MTGAGGQLLRSTVPIMREMFPLEEWSESKENKDRDKDKDVLLPPQLTSEPPRTPSPKGGATLGGKKKVQTLAAQVLCCPDTEHLHSLSVSVCACVCLTTGVVVMCVVFGSAAIVDVNPLGHEPPLYPMLETKYHQGGSPVCFAMSRGA